MRTRGGPSRVEPRCSGSSGLREQAQAAPPPAAGQPCRDRPIPNNPRVIGGGRPYSTQSIENLGYINPCPSLGVLPPSPAAGDRLFLPPQDGRRPPQAVRLFDFPSRFFIPIAGRQLSDRHRTVWRRPDG